MKTSIKITGWLLLFFYLTAICNFVFLNLLHELDHLIDHLAHIEHQHESPVDHDTSFSHMHSSSQTQHHSHGQFMDLVLRSVNDRQEQDDTAVQFIVLDRLLDHVNSTLNSHQAPLTGSDELILSAAVLSSQTDFTPLVPPPKFQPIYLL